MLNRNFLMTDAGKPAQRDAAVVTPSNNEEEIATQKAQSLIDSATGSYLVDDPYQQPTYPVSSDTGLKTSEGISIESSYADPEYFWRQINMNNILDNTPSGAMSYQGYLAYNGLVDPRVNYARSLDQANEMYARALGTYGASGEGLAQGNLINAGYSEYLTGLAYQNKANMYSAAAQQLNADEKQTAMQYRQYLNDFEATKAADDAAEDAAEVAGQAGVLTERESSIVDILGESGVSPQDIEQALLVMRSKGFTDEEFEHAWRNYTALLASEQDKKIANTKELATGKANELKEFYGEGDEYEAALGKLQEKNKELVDSAVKAIENVDFENVSDELFSIIRESTATTDKDGNTTYEWDSMSDGNKAVAIRDYIKEMYKKGDISQETYNNAMYRYYDFKIDNEISKHKELFGRANEQIKAVAEQLAKIDADKDMFSEAQYKALRDKVKDKIKVQKDDPNSLTLTIDGRSKKYRFSTVPMGKLKKDEEFDDTPEEYKVNIPEEYANGTKTGYFKTGWKDKDGVESWFYSDGERLYKIDTMGDFTRPQTDALLNMLYGE